MKIQGKTAAQIVDCVRALVQSQQLLRGQALPPVRELAAELDINRNTVAAAYKRLAAAGIALTQGAAGHSDPRSLRRGRAGRRLCPIRR